MRYFKINVLGDTKDRDLAFLDREPDDLNGMGFCMAMGERIGVNYPDDARVALQPESPGIKLSDLVGNRVCYLVVSTRMKEAIASCANVEIEYLPLTIFNHRGRLHSDDYWIVNPIGTVDCLDEKNSDVIRGDLTGEIVNVRSFAFRADRLALADDPQQQPSILRVKHDPSEYFVDEPTARAIHSFKCTNVLVHEVPCA